MHETMMSTMMLPDQHLANDGSSCIVLLSGGTLIICKLIITSSDYISNMPETLSVTTVV
jgi:hypothetical protein